MKCARTVTTFLLPALIGITAFLVSGRGAMAGDPNPSSRDEPATGNPLLSDSIVEKAIRKSIKKPNGDLNQADLEKVTHLVLANTGVTDAGLKELPKLPNLSSLALAFCRNVTDAGLKHVAMCEQLTTLSLVFTKVTDAGLDDVAKLSKLTSLGLSNTRVTEAGVIRLKKK
jgi:hypothetical protein